MESSERMGLPAKQPGPLVRLILVGRTGTDAALRQDPAYEVCRASTPLEAMGEVAHPLGPSSRTVVVLGSDVVENLRATDGLSTSEVPPNRVADFVTSLKRLDEALVVLGVAGTDNRSTAAEFDGWVDPQQPGEAVQRSLRRAGPIGRGNTPAANSPPAQAPLAVPTPNIGSVQVAGPAVPRPGTTADEIHKFAVMSSPDRDAQGPTPAIPTADAGDGRLVALSVRGVDVTEAALALARERTGNASIRFVPLGEALPKDAAAETGRFTSREIDPARPASARIESAVAWEHQVFGALTASADARIRTSDDLAPHAKWLAGWLRLAAQQAQLREAAFKDGLTGAWNRRYFDRFLEASIAQARAARRMLTVMVFDIDDFKHYNDRYGHDAGDEILIETVKLLGSVIRPTDRVSRIGGDEFAVIFDDPEGPRQEGSRHPGSVFEIAQRFQAQIGRHRFPKLGDQAAGRLTVSGGLATYPWDGQTAKELVCRADQLAMYGKKQGKNAMTLGPRE